MREWITDDRILLRKYRLGDEYALFDGISESIADLRRWGFYHDGFALSDAKADVLSRINNWNEKRSYTFYVEEIADRLFVGNCKIEEFEPDRKHAALGWWIRTSRTRRGIATAAARLVAQIAFDDLGLISLGVYANRDNVASRRVAEKLGAVLVEIKPEKDGNYCAVYELKPNTLNAS